MVAAAKQIRNELAKWRKSTRKENLSSNIGFVWFTQRNILFWLFQ
jgi:hypothetical protein